MRRRPTVVPLRGDLPARPSAARKAADGSSIGAFGVMRSIDELLGPPVCFILGLALSLIRRLRRRSETPAAPAKVLVIKFWGMGSIVLTTPALRALKKAYPACHITFLTFDQNESMCRMIPSIDRVYPYRADGAVAFLRSFARLVGFLRRERFDLALDFEFFANFTAILAGIADAPMTVGFHSPKFWRDSLYTTPVRFEHAHITENFLKLAKAAGGKADGHELDAPVVGRPAARVALNQLLSERKLARTDHLVCVNINASSLDYKRRWPIESYRQLIERILTDFDRVRLVLIGSKDEAPYVARLTRLLGPRAAVVDLCGLLTVEQLALLLRRSALFIGNDSGPLHLAAAAGIPTVSFFGPETPALYGPRGGAHTIFYAEIPCSPCLNVYNSKDNSHCRDNVCMQSIPVDEVWAAVFERLTGIVNTWPTVKRAERWR